MRQPRKLFFLFIFLAMVGCTPPYLNLRQPIYLVTHKSFFFDCENEVDGLDACRERRIQAVRKGIDDWFKHFAEPTRPQAFIVASRDKIPANTQNPIIYLVIMKGFCRDKNVACYFFLTKYDFNPLIVFDSADDIDASISAHEFGHALGRNILHNDMPADADSIMSYTWPSDVVVPIDIKILCRIHDECPPHEDDW